MGAAHQLTTVGGIASARAIGSKICSFHLVCLLKAHDFFCSSCKSVLQAPSGSCFVNKFCILSAVSSADVCESNQKENLTGTIIICQYTIRILFILV